jgi:hypothetical protein
MSDFMERQWIGEDWVNLYVYLFNTRSERQAPSTQPPDIIAGELPGKEDIKEVKRMRKGK